MKKQNVNITLLATLVTGLLTLSQGAMATSGTTVDIRATVQPTTCNVSTGAAGSTTNAAFGTIPKADLTGGAPTTIEGAPVLLVAPSSVQPITLSVSGCTGDALAAGGTLSLIAQGPEASGAAKDALYGDNVKDQGFGFALGYEVKDKTAAGTKTNNAASTPIPGWVTPKSPTLKLYEATAVLAAGDLADIDFDVAIKPQVGSWTGATVQEAALSTPVTFSVAMN